MRKAEDQCAVNGWRAVWIAAATDRDRPQHFAVSHVQRHDVCLALQSSHREDLAACDGNTSITSAQTSRTPQFPWPLVGPSIHQSRLGRNPIAIRTTPLRPIKV